MKVPESPDAERFVYLCDVLPTAWQAVEYAAMPRRWVDDIMPLLTDDDPLGVGGFATHRLSRGCSRGARDVPEEGEQHGQGGLKP